MLIDARACKTFWNDYLDSLPASHGHRQMKPDAFAFGDSIALADELARLVWDGTKRATTSLPEEFTALGEALPEAGDLSIITRGNGTPVSIIERTSVRFVRFDQVDQAFAAVEGEGDASLACWQTGHRQYFTRVCARLGGVFGPDTRVICQIFRVVWRSAPAVWN